MFLLHAHTDKPINEMHLGEILALVFDEIILHALLDTLKIVLFLFAAYLIMEFIEHKASGRLEKSIKKAGALGPLVGGAVGAIPQCGFSALAANFFTGRIITAGTLIAVFLSTSDEMLPVLLSGNIGIDKILLIIGYKALVGIIVGFIVDLVLRFIKREEEEISIDEICENDNCHCERGIFHSAIHHTLTVGTFVLLVTFLINALVLFIGEENLTRLLYNKPVIGHFIAAVFGLIPNCAASVVLCEFCVSGYITTGTMLSGLFSGAGVGLLVLFRVNKRMRENLIIVALLLTSATLFGLLADAMGFLSLAG